MPATSKLSIARDALSEHNSALLAIAASAADPATKKSIRALSRKLTATVMPLMDRNYTKNSQEQTPQPTQAQPAKKAATAKKTNPQEQQTAPKRLGRPPKSASSPLGPVRNLTGKGQGRRGTQQNTASTNQTQAPSFPPVMPSNTDQQNIGSETD